MQIVKIDNGRRSELYAANLIRRRARARVVPWANDQKMFRARLRRSIRGMIAIKRERAEFVAIVLTCDRQNRQRDFLKLLTGWHHRVVVRISHWMFENALKIGGGISNERIE